MNARGSGISTARAIALLAACGGEDILKAAAS
jgi:hypothetical protein